MRAAVGSGTPGATASRGRRTSDYAPLPRRVRRPRWLDWRILVGVVLVVGAVVLGARVIGASSRLSPVWTAKTDLAAGKVLTANDLVAVEVNLGDTGRLYLPNDRQDQLIGSALTVDVEAGQLIPLAAVSVPSGNRVIVVNVDANQMPAGVMAGSRVDLYLAPSGPAAASATGSAGVTRRIGQHLTVQAVQAPASGGLSGAVSSTYQLSLLLDQATAESLTQQLPTGDVRVVLETDK